MALLNWTAERCCKRGPMQACAMGLGEPACTCTNRTAVRRTRPLARVMGTLGRACLHKNGAAELIRVLLQASTCDLEASDNEGHTPLLCAVSCGNTEAVEYVGTGRRNGAATKPQTMPCVYGCRKLLSYGPNLQATVPNRITAAMLAAAQVPWSCLQPNPGPRHPTEAVACWRQDHVPILQALFSVLGHDVLAFDAGAVDNKGWTCVHVSWRAAGWKEMAVVVARPEPMPVGWCGNAVFGQWAAATNSAEAMAFLLSTTAANDVCSMAGREDEVPQAQ